MGAEPILCGNDYPGRRLIGCGSIVAHADERSVVWGTGIGERQQWVNPAAEFLAVRGPLTRAAVLACGGLCPEVYGDPGLLLSRFYTPRRVDGWKLGILPHYVDFDCARRNAPVDTLVIDITRPIESVVDAIGSCGCIVSSSLHGLVFSVAYGVDVAWARLGDRLCGDGVKFHDFWLSLGNSGMAPCLDLVGGTWPSSDELVAVCKSWGQPDTQTLMACCPIANWPTEESDDD
jgi:hypothetical protein